MLEASLACGKYSGVWLQDPSRIAQNGLADCPRNTDYQDENSLSWHAHFVHLWT
jgi:hypothetical protein